jgi:hypothetical protein
MQGLPLDSQLPKAHRIPADLAVVKAFVRAPAMLDLFMWLAYFNGGTKSSVFGGGITGPHGNRYSQQHSHFVLSSLREMNRAII